MNNNLSEQEQIKFQQLIKNIRFAEDENLNGRIVSGLMANNVIYLGQLLTHTTKSILRFSSVGATYLHHIEYYLASESLKLGQLETYDPSVIAPACAWDNVEDIELHKELYTRKLRKMMDRANIRYLGELLQLNESDILKLPNVSEGTLNALNAYLEERDVHLGMVFNFDPDKNPSNYIDANTLSFSKEAMSHVFNVAFNLNTEEAERQVWSRYADEVFDLDAVKVATAKLTTTYNQLCLAFKQELTSVEADSVADRAQQEAFANYGGQAQKALNILGFNTENMDSRAAAEKVYICADMMQRNPAFRMKVDAFLYATQQANIDFRQKVSLPISQLLYQK